VTYSGLNPSPFYKWELKACNAAGCSAPVFVTKVDLPRFDGHGVYAARAT
jgi:hypothetical protein